jgi:5-formyltetrahydrofolate cyclo-ligase
LGYGGGFYDRYIEKIEKIKKVIKIGLAFSFQKISSVPTNQFDKKLDFIITEKEILK